MILVASSVGLTTFWFTFKFHVRHIIMKLLGSAHLYTVGTPCMRIEPQIMERGTVCQLWNPLFKDSIQLIG